jgi:RNA polymerase sigma factor (TIGR02999 family)
LKDEFDDPPAADSSRGEVTRLLLTWRHGDDDALNRLLPLVYGELRRLARSLMRRERRDHTLQPTALVHEAYMKLFDQRQATWQDRAHFFGVAARAMREILVDHARRRGAVKRGGDAARVSLDDVELTSEGPSVDLIALDIALDRLATFDAGQARLVELRFFAGLTIDETATVLGCSAATVTREWRHAEAWLHRELVGVPA